VKEKISNGNFENGTVNISEDVISIIANIAASEVEGVEKMTGGITGEITEMLGMKSLSKGVEVYIDNNDVKISMNIAIEYGNKIKEVAEKVQEKVKETVETMTGLNVNGVNIGIQEVVFPKKNKDSDNKEA